MRITRRWGAIVSARWRAVLASLGIVVTSLTVLTLTIGCQRERRAIRAIEREGGAVYTRAAGPLWMRHLLGAKLMERVDPIDVVQFGYDGTDFALGQLREIRSISSLLLEDSQVTDSGLAQIGSLVSLKQLTLSRCRITDSGLVHLRELTNLQQLDLDGTEITGSGLVHLEQMQGLRSLSLAGCRLNDIGLSHLPALPNLETLFVDDTDVSDEGLRHLTRLPRLVDLYVGKLVTVEGVAALKRSHPGIHIAWW